MSEKAKPRRRAKPPLSERAGAARDAFGFAERPDLSRPAQDRLPRRAPAIGRPDDKAAAVGLVAGAGMVSFAPGSVSARRTLVVGTAGLITAAALLGRVTDAHAAVSTAPQMPTAEQAQMLRLSFGLTPVLMAEVAAAGGVAGWIDEQFAGVPDPDGDAVDGWFPYLDASPQEVLTAVHGDFSNAFLVNWTRSGRFLMRALYSRRQLFERTVDFFSNYHLNVPTLGGDSYLAQPDLDRIVREHAWGTFEQLLSSVVTSAAMMLYLDGYASTATRLNENLGRELLELHTVGKAAGYTEEMVRDSARLLTGYGWDGYDPAAHSTGPVQVLGFSSANSDPDGRAVVQDYLKYLAHHPATAKRLATRLIQYFCTDTPSASYVQAVATAYLDSGTDLKVTLKAVFGHADFGTIGQKLASPLESLLASWRIRGMKAIPPTWNLRDGWFDFATCSPAIAQWWAKDVGQEPLAWQTPDGYPTESAFWDQANSFLATWNCHVTTASRTPNVVGFTAADFDQTFGISSPIRFDDAVHGIANRVWGQRADQQLMSASAAFFGITDTATTITNADWVYQNLNYVVQFALNHPLAVIR